MVETRYQVWGSPGVELGLSYFGAREDVRDRLSRRHTGLPTGQGLLEEASSGEGGELGMPRNANRTAQAGIRR